VHKLCVVELMQIFSYMKVFEDFFAYLSSQIGIKPRTHTPQPKYSYTVKILLCCPFQRQPSSFQRGNRYYATKPWELLVTAGRK